MWWDEMKDLQRREEAKFSREFIESLTRVFFTDEEGSNI
jgi:hypothetical protein